MGADIDNRAGKIAVSHSRHGDQELTVKKPAFAVAFQSVDVDHGHSLSIHGEMKSRKMHFRIFFPTLSLLNSSSAVLQLAMKSSPE
jgi:hypothetical protein